MEISEKPIGIFDSGIGGLTVLGQIMRLLPNENLIYLGDEARVPYGSKSPSTVIKYSIENTNFLIKKGIKLLVVACNTASALSLSVLREKFDIPIIGVIEPGVRKALEVSKNLKIGVIGTEATTKSDAYVREIIKNKLSAMVFQKACPLFVPLVEEGWVEEEVTYKIAEIYLSELREKEIDTLILGCTHYPLLKEVIQKTIGSNVYLVDSAVETAGEVRRILERERMMRISGRERYIKFFVTDNPEKFSIMGKRFLGERIRNVEKIDL